MLDQPRRHPRFLILLGLVALATVPLPFVGGELRRVWGLPLWLWWSLGFTVAMAALTSWALLSLWSDDDTAGDLTGGRDQAGSADLAGDGDLAA